MKKIALSMAILLACFATSAQTKSILLYGDLGFASSNISNTMGGFGPSKETTSLIDIGAGYQYNANWTVGLNFGYTEDNQDGSATKSYFIDPFIRYSKPITSIFSIYGQFQAGYSHSSLSPNPTDDRSSGYNMQIYPAVFIHIKNGFGLNFSFGGLQYSALTEKDNTGYSSSNTTFAFTFGQGVLFGISKNFGGK